MAQPPTGGQPVNPSSQATQPAVPPSGPNANPLDLFPQVRIRIILRNQLKKASEVLNLKKDVYCLLFLGVRVFQIWVLMQQVLAR